jgi:deoxyadenosine/deoxycytidine kinase
MRICIEGNIASSKSTLMAMLERREDLAIYPEPVAEWGEWLALFYKDTKRWAFGFQMKVLASFLQRQYDDAKVCIVERSMLSTRHVFGQLLFNQNLLAQKEWDLFRSFADTCSWQPDAIIYVACPPEVCMQRMFMRGRAAESGVTLDYLRKVDFMYTQMLKYFKGKLICIDGNRPVEEVYADVAAAVRDLHSLKASREKPDAGQDGQPTPPPPGQGTPEV